MICPHPDDRWYQKRPGGAWYKARDNHAYYEKACEACGQEARMTRKQRFCSKSCAKKAEPRWHPAGPDHPNRIGNPGYNAAHTRVERANGKASEWFCVDCPTPTLAAEWSYDGLDPDELIGTGQYAGRKYSLKIEHYHPRCKQCHTAYDVEHGNRSAKLTDAQHRGIELSILDTGSGAPPVLQKELAQHFGVSETIISRIRRHSRNDSGFKSKEC